MTNRVHAVMPREEESVKHARDERRRWQDYLVTAVGMTHLAATLFGSIRFLSTSRSSLVNDLFWREFNATAGGTFVANAFNRELNGRTEVDLDLTSAVYAPSTDLSSATAVVKFSPTYARMLQYHRLTSIEDGIDGLRHTTVDRLPWISTQYCWVDFDRRWSLAHTAKRDQRCHERYVNNGAVYLETMLRNTNWAAFRSQWGGYLEAGIVSSLVELNGSAFLDGFANQTQLSIAQEAAYWRSKNITHYTLQYTNFAAIGVEEKVDIINAFGIAYPLTIKRSQPVNRLTSETTAKMYWLFLDDLWATFPETYTLISNMSLVRESSNFYEARGVTMEEALWADGDMPYPLNPPDQLWRERIGPFNSVDMYWVMFPKSLQTLLTTLDDAIGQTVMISEEVEGSFLAVCPLLSRSHLPQAWIDEGWSFVGGSPLCHPQAPMKYSCKQFSFDDTCSTPVMEDTKIDSTVSVLMRLTVDYDMGLDDFVALCSQTVMDRDLCTDIFARAHAFVTTYIARSVADQIRSLAAQVVTDVMAMNVSVMQFATRTTADNTTENALLLQPLLSPNSAMPWTIFGWISVYAWGRGNREVVSFQGDNGTLTLISAYVDSVTLVPNLAEVPATASFYLLLAVQYVTLVLIGIASVVCAYAVVNGFNIAGQNLLAFNRVSGMVG